MARKEEKAQSMLNRYLQSKKGDDGARKRRPFLATLCDDVDEAEKWRLQILGDIRRRVSEIQNPGLGEEKIRELNDSINKLLRERGHWERRIVFLGGRNHGRGRTHQDDAPTDAVVEHNGYYYFGEAKNLPGVKELVERKERTKQEIRKRGSQENASVLHGRVDIEYYGYLDDHDGELEMMEIAAEEKARRKLMKEWEKTGGPSADEKWDDSYVQFVGRKPEAGAEGEASMQELMLERKKAEAMEQLELGSRLGIMKES